MEVIGVEEAGAVAAATAAVAVATAAAAVVVRMHELLSHVAACTHSASVPVQLRCSPSGLGLRTLVRRGSPSRTCMRKLALQRNRAMPRLRSADVSCLHTLQHYAAVDVN